MDILITDINCSCHNVPIRECPAVTGREQGAIIEVPDESFEVLGVGRRKPPPFPSEPWPGWVVETDLYNQRVRTIVNFASYQPVPGAAPPVDGDEVAMAWFIGRHGSATLCPWSPDAIVEVRDATGDLLWRRA